MLHALGDLLLTRLEIPRALSQLLYTTIQFVGPRAFEIARRPVQRFQCRIALRGGSARGATHGVGRLLQALRGVTQLRVVLLARQPLQSACVFLGLTRQLPLRPAVGLLTLRALLATLLTATSATRRTATAARRTTTLFLPQPLTHRFSLTLHPLILLLLPLRELSQLLQRFVDGLLCALLRLRLLLHGFVLIAELVVLELEQVGQVLRLLSAATTTAASTATAAHLHLHVAVQRLRALQMLQCLLLEWQRVGATSTAQLLLGQLHRGRCRLGLHTDLGEHRVAGREPALFQTVRQLRHFFAQPPFGDRERGDVFATLLVDRAAAVAQPVEGAGHHFLLPRHEAFG